jgi:hypothetical protein
MLLKKSGSKASTADVTFGSDVCAVDSLDELLIRRELLIDRSLGVVELFLRVVLTAEHGSVLLVGMVAV